ncbi:MAG: preprotein translocase subunit SecG [Eubacterium sp.]|nr:preprotein translocase subunit SecG [Eubacterium sp.]
MEVLKTVIIIAFIIVSIVLTIIVLMQEGKDNGISGALTGATDSYWAKNKGRSKDAVIKKVTVVLAVLYFVFAILLRSKWLA